MTKVKMLSAAALLLAFGVTAQAQQPISPDLSVIDSFTDPMAVPTVPVTTWAGKVKFTKVTGCAAAAATFKLNDVHPLFLKPIGTPLVLTVVFADSLYLVVGGTTTFYGGAKIPFSSTPPSVVAFPTAYSYQTLVGGVPTTITPSNLTFTFKAHITKFYAIAGCMVDVSGVMKKI